MSGLPTELWRHIIRQAAQTPMLHASWEYSPDVCIWEGWEGWEKRRKTSIATDRKAKLAIMLVCKQWKEFGVEHLYDSIRIPGSWSEDGNSNLSLLVERLAKSTSDATKDETSPSWAKYGYGWWTKRIDCHARILSTEHIEHLIALLEQCHNLQIFTVSESNDVPVPTLLRLSQVLQTRFPNSLQRLTCPPTEPSTGKGHDAWLPNLPLTSLTLRVRDPQLDFPHLSIFENITTLTVGFLRIISETPPWHFPHLHSLGLTHLGEADFPALRPFIERHHSTLRHLFLHISHSSVDNLPLLISGHPKLVSLSLDDLDLKNLANSADNGDEMLPIIGLTHLGIISIDTNDSPERIRNTVKRILGKNVFPDLKVVRALSERNPVSSGPVRWLETIKLCQGHGVRLEDLDGQSLVVEGEVDGTGTLIVIE